MFAFAWVGVFNSHAAFAGEPPRPLVVVFAGSQNSTTSQNAKGLGASPAGSDALTPGERSLRAAQAVRERLDDAGVFTTALYNPDAALFLRAMHEGKIHLSRSDAPTDKERRALGKAAGAVYVVWVGAAQISPNEAASGNTSGSIEIEMLGADVVSGSGYSDHSRTQAGAFFAPLRGSGVGDSNAVPSAGGGTEQRNLLLSAANTLVTRLLAGPLREFVRPAPPPNLLPPPIAPPASDTAVVAAANDIAARNDSDARNSAEALSRAEGLLGGGNMGAAIVLMRQSISLYPTNLYLRAALARAYSMKVRWDEAASEARRALILVPLPDASASASTRAKDTETRLELTHLFSDALQKNGDMNAARRAYEQIIAAIPDGKTSAWARIGYADLLLRQNKPAEAQSQIQAVQAVDAQNTEAPALLARYYAAQGDYKAALSALSSAAAPQARSRTASVLFDEGAIRLADTLTENRTAWETGKITREGMYKATQAQATRAGLLADLLKSAPSAAPADSSDNKAYLRRLHAAQVLVQAVSSLLVLLDSGDRDAGDEATLLLNEFRKEVGAAQNATQTPPTGINR